MSTSKPPNWIKQRNILAFPYRWQYPVKTEEWAYQRCLVDLENNKFMQMLCFPWATLIDLLRKGKQDQAEVFINALRKAPPRITLRRATVCQHIYLHDLLPFFKQLKITDIFWSHARINEPVIEGIKIHSFPLYPVRYAEKSLKVIKPLSQRRYLYSFIGTYQADLYLSPVRQWLFDLPESPKGLIEQRTNWHYEQPVYGEQIAGIFMRAKQQKAYQQSSLHYEQVLAETVFCLCPSGSGVNSIRLWEALAFGCIPVILSDHLKLPGDQALWQEASLQISESEANIKNLPAVLSNLSLSQFSKKAAKLLRQRYGTDDFIYDIRLFSRGLYK
ncbi:MAG: exostosin family protein [Methylococcales bacterium]|nr:exostosin family protein [Methylococcales bacterium]